MRRSSPQTFSTSSASWTPSTRRRLARAMRAGAPGTATEPEAVRAAAHRPVAGGAGRGWSAGRPRRTRPRAGGPCGRGPGGRGRSPPPCRRPRRCPRRGCRGPTPRGPASPRPAAVGAGPGACRRRGRGARRGCPCGTGGRSRSADELADLGLGGLAVVGDARRRCRPMQRVAVGTRSIWWVEQITEAPCSTTSARTSTSVSWPGLSRPTKGSSMSITRKGRMNPRMRPVFCLRPRLNRDGRSSTRSVSPNISMRSSAYSSQSTVRCIRAMYSTCSQRLRSS